MSYISILKGKITKRIKELFLSIMMLLLSTVFQAKYLWKCEGYSFLNFFLGMP